MVQVSYISSGTYGNKLKWKELEPKRKIRWSIPQSKVNHISNKEQTADGDKVVKKIKSAETQLFFCVFNCMLPKIKM